MQINGPIPFHVAKAYGVKPGGAPAPLAATGAAPAPFSIAQASPLPTANSIDALSQLAAAPRSAKVDRLVGGTVNTPLSFDGAATRTPGTGSLQLYTRAADKIEAAVAVNVGRAIDVTG
jgi:hypothetical protein